MDALLIKDDWQKEGGSLDLIDRMKAVAEKIAPDWAKHWITKTNWQGKNTRFVTPFPHPVAFYGNAKAEIYSIGPEIEGCPGVFPLTFNDGVPDELRHVDAVPAPVEAVGEAE